MLVMVFKGYNYEFFYEYQAIDIGDFGNDDDKNYIQYRIKNLDVLSMEIFDKFK